MNITKNFTLEELIKSETATRLRINNQPNSEQLRNLKKLCDNILQPIRDAYKQPIIVTSGFRCPELNKRVGGVPTSEHMKGMAADIRTVSDNKADNLTLFNICKQVLADKPFGQLINEYGCDWIHVSYNENNNRREILHIGS